MIKNALRPAPTAQRRLALLLCGLMALASHNAPSESLLRAAVLVADAEASIAFYRGLGLEVELDQANPRRVEGNFFPLNVPAEAVRLVIMAQPEGLGGKIGLVEFSSPTPAEARRDPSRVGIGDVVLVFDVPDAEATHAKLQSMGTVILEPPQVYQSKRRDATGRALSGKVFHVRDPDGYLVELLQAPQ